MFDQDEKQKKTCVPDVQIVCAVARGGAFGYKNPCEHENQMPWGHISEDMKNFQSLTRNSIVMMGTATYWSLPEKYRPLPGRHNVVIGKKNVPTKSEHVNVFSDIDTALNFCHEKYPGVTIFLIGGKQLIMSFLNPEKDYAKHVSEIHRTMILRDVAVSEAGVIKNENTFVFFEEMLHPDVHYTDYYFSSHVLVGGAGISITNFVRRVDT